MNLEVGMYVRTKKGIIDEVIIDYNGKCILRNDVIKASHNIIDLIEVGDYVNGKLVSKVSTDYIFDYSEEIKIIYFEENDYIYSMNKIKSIVTKEQFESMKYEVKENE